MREIRLTRGKVALIDDADYDRVSQTKWQALLIVKKWYAKGTRSGKDILLHRFLMDAPTGLEVDHKDGNGLNCCKDNLRLCSHSKNQMNLKKRSDNRSGYKGVSWDRANDKWRASIQHDHRFIGLGRFNSPEVAARAYDAKALELFGEFAWLNFPQNTTQNTVEGVRADG